LTFIKIHTVSRLFGMYFNGVSINLYTGRYPG
jgi:hypothetical protein